jgi:transcriptional regulator with XRE-family HTH domain
MARETFTDRLNRFVEKARLSEADIASALGMSATQAGRLLDGTTKTLKLEQALKLCRRLGVSPWELAGEREPVSAGPARDIAPDPLRAISTRVDELTRLILRTMSDQLTPDEKARLQGVPTIQSRRSTHEGSQCVVVQGRIEAKVRHRRAS